ncbi:hypothetical protein LX32DRAFT_603703, partial [Colletotrichum zoysiae]
KITLQKAKKKTYNTRYSLIVTDSTTNPALTGLSMGERTGSRVLQWVWSYVLVCCSEPLRIVFSRWCYWPNRGRGCPRRPSRHQISARFEPRQLSPNGLQFCLASRQ